MQEVKLTFAVVPDYVCSGVQETYFKVSCLVSHYQNGGIYWNVFSVIMNSKTKATQKQGKVKLDWKHASRAAYGDRKSSKTMYGTMAVGNWYLNDATDDEKSMYCECVSKLKGAFHMMSCRDTTMPSGAKANLRMAVDQIIGTMLNVRNGAAPGADIGDDKAIWDDGQSAMAVSAEAAAGAFVMGVPEFASEQQAKSEFVDVPEDMLKSISTEEFTTIVNELSSNGICKRGQYEYRYDKETKKIMFRPLVLFDKAEVHVVGNSAEQATTIARKAKTMARMVNAGNLLAFVNGNLYDVIDGSVQSFNGKRYMTLVNDDGEECFVDDTRFKLEMVYTDNPESGK